MTVKWLAKLECSCVLGNQTVTSPEVGGLMWCDLHQDGYVIVDLVTDEPERTASGRAW